MLVKYVGPHDEVELAATGAFVERGGQVEVSDELGDSLCDQLGYWEAVAEPVTSGPTDLRPAPAPAVVTDVKEGA